MARMYMTHRELFGPDYFTLHPGKLIFFCSEKRRIPAWCDRILWKGSNIHQLEYDTAPLMFSDHRPVYGVFECTISIVDERSKEKISRELYEKHKHTAGSTAAQAGSEETDEEDELGGRSVAPGLPISSSDRRKWWLDHGENILSILIFFIFTDLN